ncbi:LLM class flavin-dependent oxidoreductase [Mycobacterium sp.]|uniref:LLM class flavin-dependent oxidoreductase n=1 Tax=Mycobacterium sp. TaxID=1785 RepID=UPI003D135DCC
MVKVGVYFDLRNPAQWRQDPSRLYSFTLEACEEAEHLGASSVWFSEHHLFIDDYLPSPLTFAAAVAARTSRVRIGTAVVIAPIHQPAEIAEQSAIVDILSSGRLDLGLGTGYRAPEFDLYDAPLNGKYARTDDTVRRLRQLWRDGGITPGPVQEKLPIWMGYQGPQGARRAGLLGERLLSPNSALWEPYSQALVEAGYPIESGRMAGGIQGWVSDDPDRDWPLVSKHLAHQLNTYRRHMVEGTDQPVPKPVDVQRVVEAQGRGPLGSFSYGTPEAVATSIRELIAGAPVDTVFLWASIGGMDDVTVMNNIHTICTRLAPLLAQPASVGKN